MRLCAGLQRWGDQVGLGAVSRAGSGTNAAQGEPWLVLCHDTVHKSPRLAPKIRRVTAIMPTCRIGEIQRKGTDIDPLKRFLAALYLQAFKDLVFLSDYAREVEVIEAWPHRLRNGNRINPDLIQEVNLKEFRIMRILEKLRSDVDPRRFFMDAGNVWHQFLPLLDIHVEPEEVGQWAMMEVMERKSETFEARAKNGKEEAHERI